MRTIVGSLLASMALLGAGCSGETPATGAGMAGASGSLGGQGGAQAGSGVGGSAGSSVGSDGAGSSSGGMSGAGGVVGGASGSGGAAGGVASSGGQGSGPHTPVPSAGCGKMNANPPDGSQTIMTGGQTPMYNIHLPDDYDGTTPRPLGFGFHGYGNGACGPNQGECRGFSELPAVTVYMKSVSDGWEQQEVLEQNIQYFQDVLAHMKADYCIDEARIFVAGVSSGGQFVEHLACRFGDTLWQVTPVSAAVVNAAKQNCKGTPPILVIHGVTDQAGGYGEDTAAMFAERNGCSDEKPLELEQAKSDLMDAFDQEQAEHVCMDWQGCTKNPVRFCLSSQITYDGLTHGWPMIGGQLISEFHATLPK